MPSGPASHQAHLPWGRFRRGGHPRRDWARPCGCRPGPRHCRLPVPVQCFLSPNRCWCSPRYGHRRGTTSTARRGAARHATPVAPARPRQRNTGNQLPLVAAWAPSLPAVGAL